MEILEFNAELWTFTGFFTARIIFLKNYRSSKKEFVPNLPGFYLKTWQVLK
jgi:hypothetical protein